MHVDAMTLAAVADEWRTLLTGGRIDTIIQPTEHSLALQCYVPGNQGQGGQNRWLYLSAHPQMARVHLTALKPARIISEPPAFVMLLRKYLEGARIELVEQPRWERVLELVAGYRKDQESDERIRFRLIIEVMGRHSNIILCNEDGLILGCLKRVGADVNRYRVVATGVPYVPPPPQQRQVAGRALPRLDPVQVTASQLSISAADVPPEEQEQSGAKKRKRAPAQPVVWQVLTRHVLGFSPLLAREAVYRTTENTETLVELATESIWEELAWNIREIGKLYDQHQWHPQLVERRTRGEQGAVADSSSAIPIAFAPYILEQYVQVPDVLVRESPSMNVLLDDFYARTEWHDAMEGVRSPIRKVLQTHLERCKRKAELLQQELAVSEEAARYRLQAELLLAHQQEIQQGPTSVDVQNFFEDDGSGNAPVVTIPLDPRFDAVGNSNRLFHKYHKLRRALTLVPDQIAQNDVELATVEQLLADLMLAETPAEVALVRSEVQAAGYIRGKALEKKAQKMAKKGKGGKGGKQGRGKPALPGGGVPLHVQSSDGFTVLIGKNSRQNEDVTFHQASPHDIWLHARGVPGSHVIIKAAGHEVPASTVEQAANLAAYYSQARGSTNVPVDYTLQRHVRHMKGGGPGMVIYERERTLYSHPDAVLQMLEK
jgi:predicted ribosome quality control (RQC) complex YloA/Tae2 family protein